MAYPRTQHRCEIGRLELDDIRHSFVTSAVESFWGEITRKGAGALELWLSERVRMARTSGPRPRCHLDPPIPGGAFSIRHRLMPPRPRHSRRTLRGWRPNRTGRA